MSAKLTTALARFIGNFRAARLPAAVRARTLELVFDGSGALVSAANPRFSTGRLIAGLVASQGGKPQASIVGHGFRSSVVNAALANGTMGYASDVEPHHPEAILHPIAVMIPTALAVGESVGASGAEFLAAVALGCEIEYRVSMALGPAEQYALGFHPSAVCGCFGATAAVTPLRAAKSGFGGPDAVFDHGHTIFRAFSRKPRPEKLIAGLGARWDGVMELAFKPYSCVSFLHPALDALLGLVRENDLAPDDIKSLTLKFPRDGIHCVDGNPLKSHCAQYILPVAVADRGLAVADIFVDRRRSDRSVAALGKRVRVVSDPQLDKLFPDFYASIVVVVTRDGRRFTRRNDIARGYPETPLTPEELIAKFERLAGSVMSGPRVKALGRAVMALPESRNLAVYAAALREKSRAR